MTWEETIQYIRNKPEFSDLVRDTYLEEDLISNINRYQQSEEYKEIITLINKYSSSNRPSIVDIGSGNGITAVNFALKGFDVTSIEPDDSETVGCKAIEKIKNHFQLKNLTIVQAFGENTGLEDESFDIIFARQAMHHAKNLELFVKEATRLIKRGGLFLTVRDHVIYNENDKKWFLKMHPLQQFYGGENAYTEEEYLIALQIAGLKNIKVLKHFDSPINYHPIKKEELTTLPNKKENELWMHFKNKVGKLSGIPFLFGLYKLKNGFSKAKVLDERYIPGRLYSFVSIKI